LKEKNLSINDIWEERKIKKEYQDSLLKELNRRETLFGNATKKAG